MSNRDNSPGSARFEEAVDPERGTVSLASHFGDLVRGRLASS
jgi:hypothetical protein